MKWKELTKSSAKVYYDKVMNSTQVFDIRLDGNDKPLRDRIYEAYQEVLNELNIESYTLRKFANIYQFDVKFGLKIYDILHNEYKMDEREAANDNIWRYLQLYLFPDIVTSRWGMLQENRLYSQSNRLYLKTLWWYIYLSFTGDFPETEEMLLKTGNSTDTIVQLTERPSLKGYRKDLYREIMKQKSEELINTNEFRTLMKINSAKLVKMNPELTVGGVQKYVSDIIKTIRK